jgi:hypothetical protein
MNSSGRRRRVKASSSTCVAREHGLKKRLAPVDASDVPASPSPNGTQPKVDTENSTQSHDVANQTPNRAHLWNYVPPTGGIALLIDILAREALKDLMAEISKG